MGKGYEVTLGYPKDSKAAEYWDYVNKGVAGYGKQISGSPYNFKSPFANSLKLSIRNISTNASFK
jgi:hypothetical protein